MTVEQIDYHYNIETKQQEISWNKVGTTTIGPAIHGGSTAPQNQGKGQSSGPEVLVCLVLCMIVKYVLCSSLL